MRIRYNAFFIPILLICAFLVWYLGFREEKSAAARRLADRSLLNIEELDIIEIIRTDQTIRLEKVGSSGEEGAGTTEDWRMVQPYESGCNPAALAELIDGILKVESERDFTDVTPEQKQEYGLSEPDMHLRLASTAGKVLMDLEIGRENTSGSARYAAFADNESTVFLVPTYHIEPFNITPNELRDTRALAFNETDLVSFQLSSAVAEIQFEKEGSGWMITSPSQISASPARLEILFQNIRELKAVEFLPIGAADPELSEVQVRLAMTLSDGSGRELCLYGEDYSRGIYATSSWQPSPFIVEAYIYDRLALSPSVFFHVLLIEFPIEEIERVRIRQPDSENLEIIRTGAGDEDWRILRPEGRNYTDPGDFDHFITALLSLQPEGTVPVPNRPEDYGFEPVYYMKIEVYRERDMGQADIYIGSQDENGSYYATQDRYSYFIIDEELIDQFVDSAIKLKGTAG